MECLYIDTALWKMPPQRKNTDKRNKNVLKERNMCYVKEQSKW